MRLSENSQLNQRVVNEGKKDQGLSIIARLSLSLSLHYQSSPHLRYLGRFQSIYGGANSGIDGFKSETE